MLSQGRESPTYSGVPIPGNTALAFYNHMVANCAMQGLQFSPGSKRLGLLCEFYSSLRSVRRGR